MTISSYQFQSPYSQQIQIGRPSPEMIKSREEEEKKTVSHQQEKSLEESGIKSDNNAVEPYKKSAVMYQRDGSYEQTMSAVNTYKQAAQEALKTLYVSAYADAGTGSGGY